MKIPLEAVTDKELLTEVARRRLDIRENVNEGMVNEAYEMGINKFRWLALRVVINVLTLFLMGWFFG